MTPTQERLAQIHERLCNGEQVHVHTGQTTTVYTKHDIALFQASTTELWVQCGAKPESLTGSTITFGDA